MSYRRWFVKVIATNMMQKVNSQLTKPTMRCSFSLCRVSNTGPSRLVFQCYHWAMWFVLLLLRDQTTTLYNLVLHKLLGNSDSLPFTQTVGVDKKKEKKHSLDFRVTFVFLSLFFIQYISKAMNIFYIPCARVKRSTSWEP